MYKYKFLKKTIMIKNLKINHHEKFENDFLKSDDYFF